MRANNVDSHINLWYQFALRVVVVHDINEVEGERQQEVQEDKGHEEIGSEVNGEVEAADMAKKAWLCQRWRRGRDVPPPLLPRSCEFQAQPGLHRLLQCHVQSGVEAELTVEEEYHAQTAAYTYGEADKEESTGLPLDPKMVAGAVKEELEPMRRFQVYHEMLESYLNESWLKATSSRWITQNKGDAAHPYVRAKLVAQIPRRVSRVDT